MVIFVALRCAGPVRLNFITRQSIPCINTCDSPQIYKNELKHRHIDYSHFFFEKSANSSNLTMIFHKIRFNG